MPHWNGFGRLIDERSANEIAGGRLCAHDLTPLADEYRNRRQRPGRTTMPRNARGGKAGRVPVGFRQR